MRQGHQPWRGDPESVVRAWAMSRWNPAPELRQITSNSFQVTEPGTNVVYTIRGTYPEPDSDVLIWVITSITRS